MMQNYKASYFLTVIKLAICLYLVSMLNACIKKEDTKSPFSFLVNNKDSCVVNSANSSEEKTTLSQITIDHVKQIQAKYADLPVPMNAIPMPEHCFFDSGNKQQIKLAYRCPNSLQSIAIFYGKAMEAWQEVGQFVGNDYVINYQRPDKWCCVIIKATNSKHEPNIVIYMAPLN